MDLRGLRSEGIGLPKGAIFPESIGQADGLSAEEYFRALRRQQEVQRSQQNTADDSDGSDDEDGQQDAGDGQQDVLDSGHTQDQGNDTNGNGEGETTDDGQDAAGDGSQPGSDAGDQGEADSGHEDASDGPDPGAGDGGGDNNATALGSEPGTHDGKPVPIGTSGSCSDGRQRPWELGPPTEDNPGLDEADAEQLIHITAKNVEKGVGKGSAGHKLWSDEILNPPMDPAAKLLSLVRKYVELTAGIGERSYRRPSRRSSDPRMCLPGNVAPVPRITVIVDTSGSMGADDLGLALGMIGKVLNSFRIRDGIRVVTGDERGQSKEICVNDPRKIDLRGGGGTDVAALVAEAMQERVKP